MKWILVALVLSFSVLTFRTQSVASCPAVGSATAAVKAIAARYGNEAVLLRTIDNSSGWVDGPEGSRLAKLREPLERTRQALQRCLGEWTT